MRHYTRVVPSITQRDGIQSNDSVVKLVFIPTENRCVGSFCYLPFELIAMPSMNNSVVSTDSESESLH